MDKTVIKELVTEAFTLLAKTPYFAGHPVIAMGLKVVENAVLAGIDSGLFDALITKFIQKLQPPASVS